MTPEQLAAIYLWNPFTIASCISGSLTSLENLALMVATYGAVSRRTPTCMFGLALGFYLTLSPILLLVSNHRALAIHRNARSGAQQVLGNGLHRLL